ncbi:MAG: thiamine phosphate synthase [Longimicrobiales bacterium]
MTGSSSERAGDVPRLHLILKGPDRHEKDQVRAVLDVGGPALAIHLRAPDLSGAELYDAAGWLVTECQARGALAFVNDRLDVALAAGAAGTHLKAESMEPEAARRIAKGGMLLGRSIHSAAEAADLKGSPIDYLFLGSVYDTPSHPGRPPIGVGAVQSAVTEADVSVIAIGGVTPERLPELVGTGIHGVAALSSVWGADHPASVVSAYLEGLS